MTTLTPTITFCVGPAGSGKTAWAHFEVQSRRPSRVQRVNLDDLIVMTHGRNFTEFSGDDVKLARKHLVSTIRRIAESGRDVLVDNAHLSTRFPNLVRDELGDEYSYKIKDFTDVPLKECVRRDAIRGVKNPGAFAGADEVERQWKKGQALQAKFGGPGLPLWEKDLNRSDEIEPYEPDTTLPKAVILDIDGTLAHALDRGPYDTSRYHTDTPEERLVRIVNDIRHAPESYALICLTGRDESHRDVTESWLESPCHVHWDELHMRPRGDMRRDNVVKLELFNKHVRDRFNVIAAFDDRDRVVRLWRRLGLLCCQVNYGAF